MPQTSTESRAPRIDYGSKSSFCNNPLLLLKEPKKVTANIVWTGFANNFLVFIAASLVMASTLKSVLLSESPTDEKHPLQDVGILFGMVFAAAIITKIFQEFAIKQPGHAIQKKTKDCCNKNKLRRGSAEDPEYEDVEDFESTVTAQQRAKKQRLTTSVFYGNHNRRLGPFEFEPPISEGNTLTDVATAAFWWIPNTAFVTILSVLANYYDTTSTLNLRSEADRLEIQGVSFFLRDAAVHVGLMYLALIFRQAVKIPLSMAADKSRLCTGKDYMFGGRSSRSNPRSTDSTSEFDVKEAITEATLLLEPQMVNGDDQPPRGSRGPAK